MQVNDAITRWLCGQLRQVPDVRSATPEPDPSVIYQTHRSDLVVATWMGARVYVYLIHTVPKLRDIRQTLKDNSRSGIGTLYIVSDALLPGDDVTAKPEDWQEVLAALNDGWIYAYGVDEGDLRLKQVHFTTISGRAKSQIWHLNDFIIETVNVRKRNLQTGLRGTFAVGDVASPDYKRKINYERANQRFHYRTRYTQDIPHGERTGGSAAQRNDERLKKYYALIGVAPSASEKEIKAAFRQRALQVHPDVSALPRSEATKRIKQLNEAYEYIKQQRGWS